MDPGTGLTILGSAVGSAKLVEKLLGPTSDYIGEGLKVWTEKRLENVSRIMRIASRKLGSTIEEEGTVPPKVLRGILDEGSFCDDDLAAEYFGGVLASSRSNVSRDDRGSSYIALLGRLSTYQIRAHYCFYHIFQSLFFDYEQPIDLSAATQQRFEAVIPLPVYVQFMDYAVTEDPINLLPHIISGLTKEQLVADPRGTGSGKVLVEENSSFKFHRDRLRKYREQDVPRKSDPDLTQSGVHAAVELSKKISDVFGKEAPFKPPPQSTGTYEFSEWNDTFSRLVIVVEPTIPGIELFLWAHGRPDLPYSELFLLQNKFDLAANITIIPKYYKPLSAY